MCEEEDAGVRQVHRPREWKEKERRQEKEGEEEQLASEQARADFSASDY